MSDTDFAEDCCLSVEPYITPDLETYVYNLASMFDEVRLYALDTADAEGWTVLLDPDAVPAGGLGYLAQYVGERLTKGITEQAQREWIKDAPNKVRGTLMSVVLAAQRNLTGNRTVNVTERAGTPTGTDDSDRIQIITYTSETPNPAQTYRDILSVLPAELVLSYNTLTGQNWAGVNAGYASWTAADTASGTWETVHSTIGTGFTAGSFTYTRPRA